MSVKDEIDKQPWFFGFLSREYIVPHLSQPGDWCVRCVGTNQSRVFIVTVKCEHQDVKEFRISHDDKKGYIAVDLQKDGNDEHTYYSTINELLAKDSEYSKKAKLLNAVSRPRYLISEDDIDLTDSVLGKGHYAEVVRATYKFDGKKLTVAVKRSLNAESLLNDGAEKLTKKQLRAHIEQSQMVAESLLAGHFEHQNVLKIYGVACNQLPIKTVLEYCPGGSLKRLLINKKESVKNVERDIFLFETAKGLRHLQLKGCVHRDVATRNCLIGLNGQIKLSDFGLSKRITELQDKKFDDQSIAWPIPWMAPETLSKHPKFSTKSDVYAFGIAVYEVYSCGGKPWPDVKSVEKIIPIVRKGEMMPTPSLMPKSIEKVMHDCWQRKAADRPDFIDLVDRFREILRTQKIPSGQERAISDLKGVKMSSNILEMDEDSADTIAAMQRRKNEKHALQMLKKLGRDVNKARKQSLNILQRSSAPLLTKYKSSDEKVTRYARTEPATKTPTKTRRSDSLEAISKLRLKSKGKSSVRTHHPISHTKSDVNRRRSSSRPSRKDSSRSPPLKTSTDRSPSLLTVITQVEDE